MNKCTKSTYLEDTEIVCVPSYDLFVSVSICYLLLQPVVPKSGFPHRMCVYERERESVCVCVRVCLTGPV